MSADLNCHTKLSDGSLGIDDLIVLAKKQGINTISITDHNCQAGNIRGELIGKRHDVKVIPGVELSSTDEETGEEVDILCYLADSPARLEGLCRRNMLACKKASQFMILGTAKKYNVTPELIVKCATGSTNIYVCHIMRALIESGFTNEFYGDIYKELFTKGAPGSVYFKAKYDKTKDVIEAIHESGGIAILAHPGRYSDEFVERMLSLGLDGLEVWCPENTEEQSEKFFKLAKSKKLLSLGGSNFRGMYNEKTLTVGSYITPDKQLDELMSYKAKQKRLRKKAEQENKKED
ncbi:MAG: PHP domain-containing protein [Ruminococcaceae bacterium]|nr:PHP domain-containing protein [Oscillospiraceae bacterium]